MNSIQMWQMRQTHENEKKVPQQGKDPPLHGRGRISTHEPEGLPKGLPMGRGPSHGAFPWAFPRDFPKNAPLLGNPTGLTDLSERMHSHPLTALHTLFSIDPRLSPARDVGKRASIPVANYSLVEMTCRSSSLSPRCFQRRQWNQHDWTIFRVYDDIEG
jgi:hypothetical protein